ncbi:MAG TPA: methylated-DNA--[protein]-cysteine S-methyltransferase [Rhodobacteraceae bacterium]|nr:methylated-DNA--[protein]-cysteine S-methyltransferase [Paracoccaceae bacterium]
MIAIAQTRFGRLGVESDGTHIVALHWDAAPQGNGSALLVEAVAQLEAYDSGRLTDFDLPLAPKGSEFQKRVYDAMSAIPYGETLTYGEIAKALGCPAQPIGQACGANPIPVIIPCHRVLSKNGIGGFSGAGGVEGKIALLKHENGFPFLL